MFAQLNARNQIVEATDLKQDNNYVEIAGTVAENMPLGLLWFNGRVYTPRYYLSDDAVVERSDEDMALDPRSDIVATPTIDERLTEVEALVKGTPSYGELLEAVNLLLEG